MAVRGLHDRDFCAHAVEPHDAIHAPALDRPLAPRHESERDEELSRGSELSTTMPMWSIRWIAIYPMVRYVANVGEANVSMRINGETAARIRTRAAARGERLSDALRRYAEEGDRAEIHPGIVFRSGPAGRRAGLVGGPDIWEIVVALRESGNDQQATARLAQELSITPDRIAAALRYAAAFPEEIEARIELHERESARYTSLTGG